MGRRIRSSAIAATIIFVGFLLVLSPASASRRPVSSVTPLQSEITVGSFANLSLAASVVTTGNSSSSSELINAFLNDTITFVNSTAFTVRGTICTVSDSGAVTSSSVAYATGSFASNNPPFPYFNDEYVAGMIAEKNVSFGNYDFHGQSLPMEKVVTANLSAPGIMFTQQVLQFDSASGILLNFTYRSVQPAAYSISYVNGSSTLTATNVIMTIQPVSDVSTVGTIASGTVIGSIAIIGTATAFIVRARRSA